MAPVASNPGRQQLRSAARSDVIVPRCRTKFGSRAFSIAGPEVWNRLPQSVRSADTVSRAGLRHVRGVRPNRAAKFRGAALLDPTKNYLPV